MATLPKLSSSEIADHLDRLSRQPFSDVLVSLLASQPTPNQIKKWASKYIDRWMQSVSMAAKLAGYNEKIEVNNTFISIKNISDMELNERIARIEQQLSNTVDITPSPTPQLEDKSTT